jgi:hypothetical protein
MKKILLTAALSICVILLFAQVDTVRLKNIQKNTATIVTDRAPQAVYIQVGGSAPLFSINYDRRFAKRVNGAGFAVGIGYYGESGASLFSIPASINYLFGKSNHFIELAAGATFISAKQTIFGDSNESTVFFHVNAGYRYQPTKGGFFFRGGISPLFVTEGDFVTSFYLGFGHNF